MDIFDLLGMTHLWFSMEESPPKESEVLIQNKETVSHKFSIPKNRPQNFEEYVGQESIKDLLKTYSDGIKQSRQTFPHTMIGGTAGMGKTSLAMLLAKELNKEYCEILGTESSELILETMRELNGGVLFIDEIHQLPVETVEKLYQVMEDFKIDGKSISHFTLIGATTEMGKVIKKSKPFYDRFKIILDLEPYTIEQLILLIRKYKERVFSNTSEISDLMLEELVKNSRGNPRASIRLLEAFIFLKNFKKVFKSFNIIGDGYTEKDLILLDFLYSSETTVGVQGLASFLGTSQENYLYEIEPFLIQNKLIIRTPRGRKISEEGIETLEKLKGIKNG